MAQFIGNAPASFTNDGWLASAYRKDRDKKDAQVMVDPLEKGLGLTAERTQPRIAIDRLGFRMNSRNENHEMCSVNRQFNITKSLPVKSVTR
jgi:hypothetical protein